MEFHRVFFKLRYPCSKQHRASVRFLTSSCLVDKPTIPKKSRAWAERRGATAFEVNGNSPTNQTCADRQALARGNQSPPFSQFNCLYQQTAASIAIIPRGVIIWSLINICTDYPIMSPSSNNSIIIFDWDDTICPSSFVDRAGVDNYKKLPKKVSVAVLYILIRGRNLTSFAVS